MTILKPEVAISSCLSAHFGYESLSVPLIRVHFQISEEFRPAECKRKRLLIEISRGICAKACPGGGAGTLGRGQAAGTALGQFWNPPPNRPEPPCSSCREHWDNHRMEQPSSRFCGTPAPRASVEMKAGCLTEMILQVRLFRILCVLGKSLTPH